VVIVRFSQVFIAAGANDGASSESGSGATIFGAAAALPGISASAQGRKRGRCAGSFSKWATIPERLPRCDRLEVRYWPRKPGDMSDSKDRRVPLLLWPFYAIWRMLTFILNVVGRLICALLGLAIMIAGVAITISVIGAPLGIPLAVLGFLLVIRALF
jgi:hypothetical protein